MTEPNPHNPADPQRPLSNAYNDLKRAPGIGIARAQPCASMSLVSRVCSGLGLLLVLSTPAVAEDRTSAEPQSAASIPCASKPGERTECRADTSMGVLVRSDLEMNF